MNKDKKVVEAGELAFIFRLAVLRNFAVLLIVLLDFFTYECSCFFTD